MALFLRERGFNALALLGGYNAWRDAGYPLVPVAAQIGQGYSPPGNGDV